MPIPPIPTPPPSFTQLPASPPPIRYNGLRPRRSNVFENAIFPTEDTGYYTPNPKLKLKSNTNWDSWVKMWEKIALAHEKKVYLIKDDSPEKIAFDAGAPITPKPAAKAPNSAWGWGGPVSQQADTYTFYQPLSAITPF